MICSTIIPTIGRPSLDRAVESVLEQDFPAAEFEVIVVNDTGRPLPPAAWRQCEQVRLITTQQRERCVARNSGAAIARGRYLHFLDDDDWLLPGAFTALRELAERAPHAAWLYGGTQLVNRQHEPLIELRHHLEGNVFVQTMAGEWIPLQSSWIAQDKFFAVGGFHPLVTATQDVELCRRITLHWDLAEVDQLVAVVGMGKEGSSTDWKNAAAHSRWARERILRQSGVFRRLRGAARGTERSSYWYGRVVRVYLTSAVWNLQRRRGWITSSRASFALAAFLLSLPYPLFPSFWQAVFRSYQSFTFAQGRRRMSDE